MAIIELCGIPGGGKTTFGKMYTNKYRESSKVISLDMYSRLPTVYYSFIFFVSRPVLFLRITAFVMKYHVKGLFLYSFHLMLRACAKYQKALFTNEHETVFVDESIFHILCTISDRILTKEEMCRWIERLDRSNVICLTTQGNFHRFHREDKFVHPRVLRGEDDLIKWEKAVAENVKTFEMCVSDKRFNLWRIDNRDFSESEIIDFNKYLKNI